MADALSKIQAGGDKVSTALSRKGLREYTVHLFTPSGNDPLLGEDTSSTPTLTLLDPSPQIANASLKYIAATGSVLEVGDIAVTYISRNAAYTALILDTKTVWRIAGPDINGDFSLVGGSLKRTNPWWEAVLRKVQ